jgi:hypothetical protein
MYLNIMEYINIYSLTIIIVRIIFIFLITRKDISNFKKWYKYYDNMKDVEESKCYKKNNIKCFELGKYYREKINYNFKSLILEIFCFINPNFYLLLLFNDFKFFTNNLLNFYSIGEFNEETLFFIIKIIFNVYIIINKNIVTNFMSNSK